MIRTSDKGVAALIAHEGVVVCPYRDSVGVWTCGIGHTAAAGAPDPATMPKGTPRDIDAAIGEAFAIFRRDLPKYEDAVRRKLNGRAVPQHQFDAAVSFHYNTGAIGRATWADNWAAGRDQIAAATILNWSKPPAIVSRRRAEQEMFADGKYPTKMIPVYGASISGAVNWKPLRLLTQAEAIAIWRGTGEVENPVDVPWRKGVAGIVLAVAAAVVGAALWLLSR